VKTGNPSACATMNWKVRKSAIALYLSVIKRIGANISNYPSQNPLFSSCVPFYARQYVLLSQGDKME
jgi:hypothetical protein